MGLLEALHSLDPYTATLLYGGVLLYLGFLVGKKYYEFKKSAVISDTIDILMDTGYLKAYKNEDDDVIIIPYEEDFPKQK